MNHVKICEAQPRRFALSEQVQGWYKTFPTDHFGQEEINDSTMLRNKPVPHNLVRRILESKILGTTF